MEQATRSSISSVLGRYNAQVPRARPTQIEIVSPEKQRRRRAQEELKTLDVSEWGGLHVVLYWQRLFHLNLGEWPPYVGTDDYIVRHMDKTIKRGEITPLQWKQMLHYCVTHLPELQRRFPDLEYPSLNIIYGFRHQLLQETEEQREMPAFLRAEYQVPVKTINSSWWTTAPVLESSVDDLSWRY